MIVSSGPGQIVSSSLSGTALHFISFWDISMDTCQARNGRFVKTNRHTFDSLSE